MAKKTETYLVCASMPGVGTMSATCSKCDVKVWQNVTILKRVLHFGVPLICVECLAKVPDSMVGVFCVTISS